MDVLKINPNPFPNQKGSALIWLNFSTTSFQKKLTRANVKRIITGAVHNFYLLYCKINSVLA